MDTCKLEDTVNTILKDAADKATQGADFLKDQVPDLVRQLLNWNFYSCVFWSAFWAAVFVACCWLFVKAWRWANKNEAWSDFGPGPVFMQAVVGVIAGFQSITNALEAIEIVVAPKVWLLHYAATMVHR